MGETLMHWLTGLLIAIGVVAAAVLSLVAYGRSRWSARTGALRIHLDSTRLASRTTHYDARELDVLPAPVQRYFRAVLEDGQPIIRAATVGHAGTFNLSQTGAQWRTFRSQQRVVTQRPGFLWDARIAMAPGLAVHVHDAYVGGEGILRAAVLGLFTVAEVHGSGDIAKGELMRFFAEAAWYPTALLPSEAVRWEAVDDHSAKATLVDGTVSVTMLFSFNAAAEIESVRAEARGATIGKTIVMIPWEARLSNYQERDGMRVPLTGEAAWLPAEGRRPYWRGRIVSLDYEFSD